MTFGVDQNLLIKQDLTQTKNNNKQAKYNKSLYKYLSLDADLLINVSGYLRYKYSK